MTIRGLRALFVAITWACSGIASAEALGPTYPIQEPSLLDEIEQTLKKKEQSGELARLQQEAIDRSRRAIEAPRPVAGLTRTRAPRTFYFDPSIVANRKVVLPDGRVLVEAGQKFNPLDQISLSKWLIFFDARDPGQVKKAEALMAQAEGRAKAILVAGSYIELQKKWQRQVFFDQGGTLVRKFGIRQVPALVSQEGKLLRIDELAL